MQPNKCFAFLMSTVLMCLCTAQSTCSAQQKDNVGVNSSDNESLTFWYAQFSREWTEALPIGNGRSGAMVYSGIETDATIRADGNVTFSLAVQGRQGKTLTLKKGETWLLSEM